jgi:hypothetical protein
LRGGFRLGFVDQAGLKVDEEGEGDYADQNQADGLDDRWDGEPPRPLHSGCSRLVRRCVGYRDGLRGNVGLALVALQPA